MSQREELSCVLTFPWVADIKIRQWSLICVKVFILESDHVALAINTLKDLNSIYADNIPTGGKNIMDTEENPAYVSVRLGEPKIYSDQIKWCLPLISDNAEHIYDETEVQGQAYRCNDNPAYSTSMISWMPSILPN